MSKSRIFFFGRNPAIMSIVDKLLSSAEYDAKGFMDEESLLAELKADGAALLVIGGGIEAEPRERMKSFCSEQGIRVLEHFGGPQALMDHVAEALRS